MIDRDSHTGGSGAALEEAPVCVDFRVTPAEQVLDVLTQLARRKTLIAEVTGIALLAGILISLVLPVRYSATTRIMTPQQSQSSASLLMSQMANPAAGSLIAAAGGSAFGLKNPNDIYIGLLNSRPIADAIIKKFELQKVYHSRDLTAARKELAANAAITSEKSGLIAVSVTDENKQRVADIANAFTSELRVLSKALAVTESSQRRLFYEEQLKSAKEALVNAEAAFQQVQQKRGLVQLDAQAKAMIEGLADLRAKVAAKQVELQAQRSYSTEHNPDVQLTERELASLKSEVARLEEKGPTKSAASLALGDVPGAGLDYLNAQHELQYRQIIFDLLLKQYDAARLDEAKYAAVIQVVEPAMPPDRKSSPSRVPIILIATFFGFLGACSFVLLADFTQRNAEFSRSLAGLRLALSSK